MWAGDKLTRRAIEVIRRLPTEAEYARFMPIKLEGAGTSWVPRQHNCHANVATVVNWYEGLKHVFGYLVLSPQMTGLSHWIVMAHSLVEPPEGGLLEVTPDAGTEDVPFIHHRDDLSLHEEFRKVVKVFVRPSDIK
ncbi:hypothetical protein [Bradyrhizobium guangxiense]|uniref:hypothetical protein n=1 Tax=Bradyrhizobium guangxiense TaxID=1325115 RepID=UPI00100895FF|nr:hypothetical protein [Bradyrhizobium guangxiense]